MKRFVVLYLMMMSWCMASWADSPLTSTNFSYAYSEHPMVAMAAEYDPLGDPIPEKLLKFLTNKKSPVDIRLAVVNELKWSSEGNNGFGQFTEALIRRYKAKDQFEMAGKLDAKTLAVYAYAMAMNNRYDLYESNRLAHEAVDKDKEHSFSVAMACALIEAQVHFDGSWSKIYPTVAEVVNDTTLKRDMRQSAIDIIMEYIVLYKDE